MVIEMTECEHCGALVDEREITTIRDEDSNGVAGSPDEYIDLCLECLDEYLNRDLPF